MKWKQFIHGSSKGYTLIELMVASGLGLLILTMVLKDTISNRSLFRQDLVRTRLNQQIRSALDIIAVNSREAGENLTGVFPAVEIVDGITLPDQLILRRNLRDEVLSLCQPIVGNTLYLADAGTTPGCIYADNLFNFGQWSAERAAAGGQLRIYLFDQASRVGEFVEYNDEVNTGTELYLEISGAPTNNYTVGSTAIYILEQWRFQVNGDLLQLEQNGDSANLLNVVNGISDFQSDVILADSSVLSSFTVNDKWTDIKSLRVSLSGIDSFGGKDMARTLSAEFFPRNVLSN